MEQGHKMLQILTQTHRIEIANLISVPDEVMQSVVGAISYNPDSIECILQSRKQSTADLKKIDASSKVQTIYSLLTSANELPGSETRESSGKIIYPDLGVLRDHFKPFDSVRTADVTYIGRERNKPSIVYSDHLKGAMSLSLIQVDSSQFPETSRLVSQLKKFDEWKRAKLRDAYVYLGDSQREYFEQFDTSKLQIFIQEDMGEKLGLSESTVSRILENRFVEIRAIDDSQKLMRSKDLFISQDNIKRYAVTPQINNIFQEELSNGMAFSDQAIANRVKNVARRTVTKYRIESEIPGRFDRQREYATGVVKTPYKLSSSL